MTRAVLLSGLVDNLRESSAVDAGAGPNALLWGNPDSLGLISPLKDQRVRAARLGLDRIRSPHSLRLPPSREAIQQDYLPPRSAQCQ